MEVFLTFKNNEGGGGYGKKIKFPGKYFPEKFITEYYLTNNTNEMSWPWHLHEGSEGVIVMNILVACEFSGVVRDAFIRCGHNAVSCDKDDTNVYGPHIRGDVLPLLEYEWDMIIAHPPCTFLANSGVRWYHERKQEEDTERAAVFFNRFLDTGCLRVCVENPIQHKYARRYIRKYDQIVQPWQFGHTERKATCLWLKGLPELVETDNVYEEMIRLPKKEQNRNHYISPSSERGKLRSITYRGIAEAMAQQWGYHEA